MVIPLGIDDCKPYQCHKLLKSLYDLMQASQTWYEKVESKKLPNGMDTSTLTMIGFGSYSGNQLRWLWVVRSSGTTW